MLKTAVNPETEEFVKWVLMRDHPMHPSDVQTFLERIGVPLEENAVAKRGPLEVGEYVRVDNNKNTNELNIDACQHCHDQAGRITEKSPHGVTVQLDNTGEKVFFNGDTSGAKTGLYRSVPAGSGVAEAAKGKLIEMVYVKDQNAPLPDKTRQDLIDAYVQSGMERGEERTRVYYTGQVFKMAYSKEGNLFFGLYPAQRDTRPTTISPTKGKVLYLGLIGHRPGGWKSSLESLTVE